jgi:hypothetical protein
MIDFKALSAPFPPDKVSWRVGSTNKEKTKGMALAYIDARDVMDRLDEVCGPAGWQCSYPHANGKTVCSIGIKIGDEWVWKANGAGDTDIEAEKGALSDALKRAAVCWGIGRYLYDLGSPWVTIEPAGRSYRIPDSELARLAKGLGSSAAPSREPAPLPPVRVVTGKTIADEPTESERKTVALLKAGIQAAFDADDLKTWWASAKTKELRASIPRSLHAEVEAQAGTRLKELTPEPVEA